MTPEPGRDAISSQTVLEKPKRRKSKFIQLVKYKCVPLMVLLVMGFYIFAFGYWILWQRVNHKAAIPLLCVFCVALFYTLFAWGLVAFVGPGHTGEGYPLAGSEEEPFLCDQQGYSFYCYSCAEIKPSRARHSSHLKRCVPVMDHYCLWMGCVIGQGNRKFFMQFVFGIDFLLIQVLVVLLVFQRNPIPEISGLAIALYALSGIWLSLTLPLFIHHVYLILYSLTTMDTLEVAKKKHFVNIRFQDRREVVQLKPNDKRPGPFDHGKWANLVSVMGPFWTWLLPMRPPIAEPKFNDEFVSYLHGRAQEGVFYLPDEPPEKTFKQVFCGEKESKEVDAASSS